MARASGRRASRRRLHTTPGIRVWDLPRKMGRSRPVGRRPCQIARVLAYTMTENTPLGLVSLYGPTHLRLAWQTSKPGMILEPLTLLQNYLGGSPHEVPEQYQTGSPLLLATAASCPTLLAHGQADKLVWHRQSERLAARLRELKVPVALLSLPWATHGFDFNLAGPGGQLFTQTLGVSSSGFLHNGLTVGHSLRRRRKVAGVTFPRPPSCRVRR